ncbi:MAG: FkbM family methyltransferase, partial [Solirubrobacterales bacterium]
MPDHLRHRFQHLLSQARKLFRILRHPAHWSALKQGVAASEEHSSIPFGFDHATVIDVGASRGQFALFAVRRFPEAKVICFEPLPEPRAALTRALGDRVDLHAHAVGSSAGTAVINISASDDSSSLLPIGERQVEEFPGTQAESSLEVEVKTLDSVVAAEKLPAPVLLKVDVQGLELEVLKGASETLTRVDEALIECSFVELYEGQALADDVIGLMRDNGHRLAGIYG